MRHLLLPALLLTTVLAAPGIAQKSRMLHLTVIQGVPRDGAATEIHILRAPALKNVIIVDRKATPADLEAAVEIARKIRAQVGDTISKDVRAVAPPASRAEPRAGTAAANRRDAMRNVLARLNQKPAENHPGYGRVKALDMIVERDTSAAPTRKPR